MTFRARWLLVVLAMSGCALPSAPVEIKIPIPVYCEPPHVQPPVLPTHQLTGGEDVFVIARAVWAELEILEAHQLRLQAAVDFCREKAKPD